MDNKEKLILMYKDYEVLSFSICDGFPRVRVIDKLEHFDLAPYGMNKKETDINAFLSRFFNGRSISSSRWDYEEILKYTGCKDGFELSFKGHGLSLSNHYWVKKEGEDLKYDDINFFHNKWDDSFAKAVLLGKYEELSKCDLNVPDIVTSGWAVKGWIYDNGPKLYKLGILKGHNEDSLGEVLASKVCQRILKEGEVVKYDLQIIGGQYASVSSSIIKDDEELVPLSTVVPSELFSLYLQKNRNKKINRTFFEKLSELGMPELYELFVKIACIRSLCFVSDLHFNNISIIYNMKTGKIRPAPIYDLAGAFGSSESGRKFITEFNKGSYFVIYFAFNSLEPDWDYSWYNPSKLQGVETDIKDIFSKSNFYTPETIERIIDVFHHQKSYLDEISKKCDTLVAPCLLK